MERFKKMGRKVLSLLPRRLSPAAIKRERRGNFYAVLTAVFRGSDPRQDGVEMFLGRIKKWKPLALFVLALGFSLVSWSQAVVPKAEAVGFISTCEELQAMKDNL